MMKHLSSLLFLVLAFHMQSISASPAQVIIIRHAEKPPEGQSLSLQGQERAAALVPFFMGNPDLLSYGAPAAIYAAGKSEENESERPVQTVQPLADALQLSINTRYKKDKFLDMVKEIKADSNYSNELVLICWEHDKIPQIAKALGVKEAPTEWKGSVYDRLWIINFQNDGSVDFEDRPQRLMYGDTSR